MPNRILRDWTDSESVNQLPASAEVTFTRLIMKVDDFGRFSANPKLLKSLLYPIRDGVRDADISRDLAACERAGLIAVYGSDSKPYLSIRNFNQRGRAEKSKYPSPPSCVTVTGHASDGLGGGGGEDVIEGVSVIEDDMPAPLGEGFRETWNNFMKFRKSIRKPLKRDSRESQLKTLAKWGIEDATESINDSIRNGWQGLFPPKNKKSNADIDHRQHKRSREHPESSSEVPDILAD